MDWLEPCRTGLASGWQELVCRSPAHADRRDIWLECTQIHLTRHFSHAHHTRLMMYNHTSLFKTSQGSSVCMRASPHPHAIHDERLSVCSSSVPRFVLFRVSLLHLALLFPLLPVLRPELLLPFGQREAHSARFWTTPTSRSSIAEDLARQ